FLPPDVVQRLKYFPDAMEQIVKKAKEAQAVKLIDQENLVRAGELNKQLDAAYKILNDKWSLGVMPYLKRASLEVYGIWVQMVSAIASAVQWAGNLLSKFGDLIDKAPSWLKTAGKGIGLFAAGGIAGPIAAI